MIYCKLCGNYETVISDTPEDDVIINDEGVCEDCLSIQDEMIYEVYDHGQAKEDRS